MSAAPQSLRQVRFTNKAFWRNPASAFFTFAFPLMFLVIFTALLGQGELQIGAFSLETTTYYVGAMAAFGVISACFTNIAIQTTFNRDARDPEAPAGHAAAVRGLHGGPGRPRDGGRRDPRRDHARLREARVRLAAPERGPLFEFVVTFLVGALSFAALALALTAVIPNAEAAPPIVNAAILPLLFLSGIFIPLDNEAPKWITTVADIFPVKHFADAMRAGLPRQPRGRRAARVRLRLGRRRDRGGMGTPRPDPRRALLQLGTAPRGR